MVFKDTPKVRQQKTPYGEVNEEPGCVAILEIVEVERCFLLPFPAHLAGFAHEPRIPTHSHAFPCILVAFVLTSCAFARTWNVGDGWSFEADFVQQQGDKVVLRQKGKNIEVSLAKLSSPDKEWIEKRAKGEEIRKILEEGMESYPDAVSRAQVARYMGKLLPSEGVDGEKIFWVVSYSRSANPFPNDSVTITSRLYGLGDRELPDNALWQKALKGHGDGHWVNGEDALGRLYRLSGVDEIAYLHVVYFRNDLRIEKYRKKLFGYRVWRMKDTQISLYPNKRLEIGFYTDDQRYKNDAKIEAMLGAVELEMLEAFK